MRIAIIGGKLQGLEACYLSRKAGYESVLFDRDSVCIASGLADVFYCVDVLTDDIRELLMTCDLCLPAIENDIVLRHLEKVCQKAGCPFLHDAPAYNISSSKIRSNRLFEQLKLRIPPQYPDASYPIIGKPSGQSGSQGVALLRNEKELMQWKKRHQKPWVLQQYVQGPSYSIEVIGNGKICKAYQVTEILTDELHDCSRVEADARFSRNVTGKMKAIGETIGNALCINGIFDVEIILGEDGNLYLLEIDARLPSQTPCTVYHSSGVNFLEILCRQAVLGEEPPDMPEKKRNVLYYNLLVKKEQDHLTVTNPGEHEIGRARPMTVQYDFFGADEAVTDYQKGCREFRAILLFTGDPDLSAARIRCEKTIAAIQKDAIS
ncbi:MAG: 3-methylornithine--L-lysine ligase PylC [Ruminococcus sp.]|jgi:pyrrolysine biosynthesis protein PylC